MGSICSKTQNESQFDNPSELKIQPSQSTTSSKKMMNKDFKSLHPQWTEPVQDQKYNDLRRMPTDDFKPKQTNVDVKDKFQVKYEVNHVLNAQKDQTSRNTFG